MIRPVKLSTWQTFAALNALCSAQNAVGECPGPMESILGASAPALELSPANSGVPLLALPQSSNAAVTPSAQSGAQDAANASDAAVTDSSDRLASLEVASNRPSSEGSGEDRREAITERTQSGLLDADSRAALVQALAAFASRTEQSSRAAGQGARDVRGGHSTSSADEGADVIPGRFSEAAGSSLTHAEPGEQKGAASSSSTAPHTPGSADSLSSRHKALPEIRDASEHSAQTIIPEEVEMVGMMPSHDTAASSETPRQGVHAVPRRSSTGAPTERPTFSLRVYAGWLPPSLRTSSVGG